jgi:ATP-binding cassette subfamily A (ABC1) protein 3
MLSWSQHHFEGNPSVLLIDEFSTGIDAKMKRDMWNTLRNVAVGKAVIITTRKFMTVVSNFQIFPLQYPSDSMEEASALAGRVGILAKRLLGKGCF